MGGGEIGDPWGGGQCYTDITTGPEKKLGAGELGKGVASKIPEDEVTRNIRQALRDRDLKGPGAGCHRGMTSLQGSQPLCGG